MIVFVFSHLAWHAWKGLENKIKAEKKKYVLMPKIPTFANPSVLANKMKGVGLWWGNQKTDPIGWVGRVRITCRMCYPAECRCVKLIFFIYINQRSDIVRFCNCLDVCTRKMWGRCFTIGIVHNSAVFRECVTYLVISKTDYS